MLTCEFIIYTCLILVILGVFYLLKTAIFNLFFSDFSVLFNCVLFGADL